PIARQTANSGSTTSNIEIHQVHATGIVTLLNVVNGDMTGIAFYDCPGFITAGMAIPAIRGLDNRSGVTSADGAPIKLVDHLLYNFPAKSLFRVSNEIVATAFTSGTATYTVTWTENGVSQTAVVTANVLNVVTGIVRLAMPDTGTDIIVQLTGAFVATVRISACIEQMSNA